MLGFESERRLKNLIVGVGVGERELEVLRQRLCVIPDFGLRSAFERVDRDCSGAVSSYEIVNFLRDNAIYHVAEPEAHSLVHFFDANDNYRLTFQEFIQMFLPCEDNILRNVTLQRPSRRVGRFDMLPRDIEMAMAAVIEREIDLARKLDMMRRELEIQYDYSPVSAFRSVDRFNKGFIDTVNLGNFLRQNSHNASELELLAIIRRIDTEGDCRINLQEFSEFLRLAVPIQTQHILVRDPVPNPEKAVSAYKSRGGSPIRSKGYTIQESGFKSSSKPIRQSAKSYERRPLHEVSQERRPLRQVVYHSPERTVIEEQVYEPSLNQYTTKNITETRVPDYRRLSPAKPILRPREEDELILALRDQCKLEAELERAKIALAQMSDFNLFDAFNIFDVSRYGSVGPSEIQTGLNAIGIYPTFDECTLFISRYDDNRNGRISFNEFQDAFLAYEKYYASMVSRRPSNYVPRALRRDDVFLPHTAAEFQNMWRTHIRVENAAEQLRQRLNSMPGFNAFEAFNSLDLRDFGSVTAEDLRIIMESRGIFVPHSQAEQVINRFDKNKNGRVNFYEFQDETRNKSPVRR